MVVPTIIPGNSVSGYEIDNSLRFNDGDSAKLGLAFGSGGNTKTWTVSCWFKRGIISSRQSFLNVGSGGSEYMSLYIDSDDKLYWVTESGGNTYRIGSSALFRDPAAWYHIVFRQDTTDGTANNRFRYYINGAEVDTGAFNAQPTQNFDGKIGGNDTHYIGSNRDGDGEFMDGYLTDYNYLDGISYDPTYFGETDDNGVWIPKAYTGSYGGKGFFLEFQQTGTSANASGIGADTSGNDNHWTPTNLAAIDVTTDTPTNNFATFNSIFVNNRSGFTPSTLREGNTGATGVNADGNVSTIGFNKGKWYWEIKIVTRVSNDMNIYLLSIPGPHAGVSASRTMMWQAQDDLFFNNNQTNATKTADLASFDDGDIVAVALDLDTSTPNVILYKNGTALNSGNAYNFNANERDGGNFIFPALGIENTSDNGLINFGNPAFALDSGNADANGHGNFEYAVPSGYFAICTKNLAEFG